MVDPRPLKLKRELAKVGTKPVAVNLPIARVLVDTGVFHLDAPFDYVVPENLDPTVQIGVRVEVEFGSQLHEGIVVERRATPESSGKLKQILKVLSPHSVMTQETLDLINQVSKRWAGSPYDVIRSAIPPRVASVDKELFSDVHARTEEVDIDENAIVLPSIFKRNQVRIFYSPSGADSLTTSLLEMVRVRLGFGQVLLIFSDERALENFHAHLLEHFPKIRISRVDAHQSRADRYRDFLYLAKGIANVGLGLRGSVFTPIAEGSTVIVVKESSELLYEPRTPGWNARDVAILRANSGQVSLILVGYCPSLEVSRLIDRQWLTYVGNKGRRNVIAQNQESGSLLPSKAFAVARKALALGPVLFLVPRKGYGNAVLCSKCRNIAHCECGGRLQINSSKGLPTCALCTKVFQEWRCLFCASPDVYLAARGIDRFTEEIGRAFPHYKVISSSGDHILNEVANTPALVIATPGAEPVASGGYAAVLLLEGNRFFGSSDLRAGERSREQFFEAAGLVAESGAIFVAFDPVHPIIAALTRWDATPVMRRELTQHEESHLPPYYRFVVLELESKQAVKIAAGLEEAVLSGRLPVTTIIRGPYSREDSLARITLAAPVADAASLIDFIHELQKRTSLSRKVLMKIRVDPYSLK